MSERSSAAGKERKPVSHHAQPPGTRRAASPPRQFAAVLFDFAGILAQVEDPIDWVVHAASRCGVALPRPRAAWLADRLLIAGRPGGPPPARIPPHLAEVFAERDLSTLAHRATYAGLAQTVDSGIDGLPEALYERLLTPDGWHLYPDTMPTLRALRAAGVPVAVVSNVGFDLRPIVAALGLAELLDALVLSYEVGWCKPDPTIFRYTCGLLGVHPSQVLVVGHGPADAGAAQIGCTTLILPTCPPGEPNGLPMVRQLAAAHPAEPQPAEG